MSTKQFNLLCKEISSLQEAAFEDGGIAERSMELQKHVSMMLYWAGRAHAYFEYMQKLNNVMIKFNIQDK